MTAKKKEIKNKNTFKFDNSEIQKLKHFASINNSQVVYPDAFVVYAPSLTLYADYKLIDENGKPKHNFKPFGLYYINEFLQLISIYNSKDEYEIEQYDEYLKFVSKDSSTIYPLTDLEILEKYKAKVNENFLKELPLFAKFTLSEDKISIIRKVGAIIKADKLIFIKNSMGGIDVKITNLELSSSGISHLEVIPPEDIEENNLEDGKEYMIDFNNFVLEKYDYTCEIKENVIVFNNSTGLLRYIISLEELEGF